MQIAIKEKHYLSLAFISVILGLVLFATQAFAATSTVNKPVGSTSATGSVIYAIGGYAELRADVNGGVGTGYSELWEKRAWAPDSKIYTVNVNATNKPAANVHYYLTRNQGYFVKATGDSSLNHTATLNDPA